MTTLIQSVIVALIISLGPTVAIWLQGRQRAREAEQAAKEREQIHILVNSRMASALKQIRQLNAEIARLKAEKQRRQERQ